MKAALTVAALAIAGALALTGSPVHAGTPQSHEDILAAIALADEAERSGNQDGYTEAARIWRGLGAAALTQDDQDLAELWWDETRIRDELPSRGAVSGPGVRRASLAAGGAEELSLAFYAGQVAVLTLRAHDNTRYTLRAKDSDEKLVCDGVSDGHAYTCRWTPLWTGSVEINVSNTSSTDGRYTLIVN